MSTHTIVNTLIVASIFAYALAVLGWAYNREERRENSARRNRTRF